MIYFSLKSLVFIGVLCISISVVDAHEKAEKETSIGISQWVDILKRWVGITPLQQNNKSEFDAQKGESSPQKNVAKEPQGEGKIAIAQSTLSDEEKKKRIKIYEDFEKKILKEEESSIASLEKDTNEKIDALMKDQRIVVLLKKNPEITLEELPEDIYRSILSLSNELEKRVNTMTEKTDQLLKEKAEELQIQDDLQKDEDSREDRSSIQITPLTKVSDVGVSEDKAT